MQHVLQIAVKDGDPHADFTSCNHTSVAIEPCTWVCRQELPSACHCDCRLGPEQQQFFHTGPCPGLRLLLSIPNSCELQCRLCEFSSLLFLPHALCIISDNTALNTAKHHFQCATFPACLLHTGEVMEVTAHRALRHAAENLRGQELRHQQRPAHCSDRHS